MSERRAKYEIGPAEEPMTIRTTTYLPASWSQVIEQIAANADQFANLLDEDQARKIISAIATKHPKVIEEF